MAQSNQRRRRADDVGPRIDGAVSSGQSSRIRKRISQSPPKHPLQKSLDAVVASSLFWDLANGIEVEVSNVGRPCETTIAAVILVDIAASLTGSARAAVSYLGDQQTWKRLRGVAQEAWPTNSYRRLPARPPSRSQHSRFRNRHLTSTSDQVDDFQRLTRTLAIRLSENLDMFSTGVGSFSNPDQTQLLAGDATFIKSMYNTNEERLVDSTTGEIFKRRTDQDANWSNNTKGNAPNYNLVDVVAQNTFPGERIILDATLRANGRGVGDGEVFCGLVDTIQRELQEIGRDVYAAVYDMALDSRDHDHLLRQGICPISKVPLTRDGKFHRHNLGVCTFTKLNKTRASLKVVVVDGTPHINVPGINGPEKVALQRTQTKRTARENGFQVASFYQIPDLPEVPKPLRKAKTRISHHSTQKELSNPNLSLRTRNLRVFARGDRVFDALFGCRETTESMHHNFKTTLVNRRARTEGAQRLRHSFHSYQMSVNITTALRHAERTDNWSMFGDWRPDGHSQALAA